MNLSGKITKRKNIRKFRRYKSSAVNATDILESQASLDTDYEKAKPFDDIPGPKGLPFIGTLQQYRRGILSIILHIKLHTKKTFNFKIKCTRFVMVG